MIRLLINANQINRLIEKQKATADEIKLAKRVAINQTVKGLRLDAGKMIREMVAVSKSPTSPKTPKQLIESRIKLFFADPKAMSERVAGGKLLVKDIKIPIRFFSPKQLKAQRAKRKKLKPKKPKQIQVRSLFSKETLKAAKKIGYSGFKKIKSVQPFGKKKRQKTVRGTSAKIMKGGSRVVYPRGFGPNTQKLGYTIWEREGKKRLPLRLQEGVDVAWLLKRRGGERRLKESANQRLQKNLVRRIKRIKYARKQAAAT